MNPKFLVPKYHGHYGLMGNCLTITGIGLYCCCKTVCCPVIFCCCCINHCCCGSALGCKCCESKYSTLLRRDPEIRTIMLGLAGVGKTTILYQMKLGQTVSVKPTIGYNVEAIQQKDAAIIIWDIGGSHVDLWKHYYATSECVIWVTDLSKLHKNHISDRNQCDLLLEGYFKQMQKNDNDKNIPKCIVDICVNYLYENMLNEKELLHKTLNEAEELIDFILLIYANKKDLQSDISDEEI
eukprot:236542_1